MAPKSKFALAGLFVLCQMIALGPISVRAQDAPPADGGDQGPLATPTLLVDLALEGREELQLTDDQAARLEAFRTASLDRSAGAREVIAVWREELIAQREALADSAGLGPRERRRMLGAAARPTPEVREALRAVRDEVEAAMDELRATLTVDQMSALREIARDEFPRLARGGPNRGLGLAPGFGPRSRPRLGPGFGPGFGPDTFPRRRLRR
jgi:hypothetical protein